MRAITTFIKTITRMIFIVLSLLVTAILVLVIVLLICSPGKPDPFNDSKGEPISGSISEKTFIKIGGVHQGMFIRGRNINNPVLLYVHGGPAFRITFLLISMLRGWKIFLPYVIGNSEVEDFPSAPMLHWKV